MFCLPGDAVDTQNVGDSENWILWLGIFIPPDCARLECNHLADVHVFGNTIICGWCQFATTVPDSWIQSSLVTIRDVEAHYEVMAEYYGEASFHWHEAGF